MKEGALARSRALWNRTSVDLRSDEVLAQILDRGEPAAWRELYSLAREDPALRARIKRIVTTVPIALPRFWLAALAALGEDIDLAPSMPRYGEK